ncbi:hypothetical protein BU23DRAFT_433319, partial [Bimuria novae-zelandiae CBS 107.79]
CSFTWPATSGDTCATMSSDWRLDEATFKAMNPGVDCSNLVPDQEYCVEWDGTLPIPPAETSTPAPTSLVPSSTTLVTVTSSSTAPGGPVIPSPIQSGVASNCQKWYLVEPDDTCQGIVDIYKTFTLAQFLSELNPIKHTDIWLPACKFLQVDVFVCVGVPGTPTAAPTATPTTTFTKGVPYDCIKWVLQKDGVYCADMATAAGLTLARFYTLNPAVGTSCSGLWPGYAYCV